MRRSIKYVNRLTNAVTHLTVFDETNAKARCSGDERDPNKYDQPEHLHVHWVRLTARPWGIGDVDAAPSRGDEEEQSIGHQIHGAWNGVNSCHVVENGQGGFFDLQKTTLILIDSLKLTYRI
jgi:hypothetical protein